MVALEIVCALYVFRKMVSFQMKTLMMFAFILYSSASATPQNEGKEPDVGLPEKSTWVDQVKTYTKCSYYMMITFFSGERPPEAIRCSTIKAFKWLGDS